MITCLKAWNLLVEKLGFEIVSSLGVLNTEDATELFHSTCLLKFYFRLSLLAFVLFLLSSPIL